MATATVAYESPTLKPGSRVTIDDNKLGYVVRVNKREALVADADGENWYKLERLTPDGYVSPDYAREFAAEKTTAHPFFISYWHPRGGKREALLWTKDEQSAVGLLATAVPGADVISVEQREVEGMKRGRNVYAMGEANEAAEPRTNREGLTFDEWLRAARLGRSLPHPGDPLYKILRAAWKRGEDPTEYAARESTGRKIAYVVTFRDQRGPRSSTFVTRDAATSFAATLRRTAGFSDVADPVELEDPTAREPCACGAAECLGLHTHGAPPPGTTVVAAAGEGPHSAPRAPAAKHECTVDSSTAIAQQIPGGPWKYLKTYPKEAPARIERQQDFDVNIGGTTQRVTAYFCGRHLLLRCPVTQRQFLFEAACVGDVPGKQPAAAPQGVQPKPGKPFTVKFVRGKMLLGEAGPFATPTEAYDTLSSERTMKANGVQKGDIAGIYKDGKLIDFRGGRGAYVFGRTRWSRA